TSLGTYIHCRPSLTDAEEIRFGVDTGTLAAVDGPSSATASGTRETGGAVGHCSPMPTVNYSGPSLAPSLMRRMAPGGGAGASIRSNRCLCPDDEQPDRRHMAFGDRPAGAQVMRYNLNRRPPRVRPTEPHEADPPELEPEAQSDAEFLAELAAGVDQFRASP